MSETTRVSVVIPWADREEVGFCLRENSTWLLKHDVEVLLVNLGGNKELIRACSIECRIPLLRHIYVPVDGFNRSLALNLGVSFSRSPFLLILDSDVILKSDFIAQAIPAVESGAFVTILNRTESKPSSHNPVAIALAKEPGCIRSIRNRSSMEIQFADGSLITLKTSATELLTGSDAGHGHVLLKKIDFLAVAGYHSKLNAWGWEDDDILFRLHKVLGLAHAEAGDVVHLTHGDDRRALFGKSKSSSDLANMVSCLQRYANSDFLGTYVEDIAKWAGRCEEYKLNY